MRPLLVVLMVLVTSVWSSSQDSMLELYGYVLVPRSSPSRRSRSPAGASRAAGPLARSTSQSGSTAIIARSAPHDQGARISDFSSDGDSDSSEERIIRPIRPKVKVTAVGPAKVSWDRHGIFPGSRNLEKGEYFKDSFYGKSSIDANVNVKPGGTAKVTAKGHWKASAQVKVFNGSSGSMQTMLPETSDPHPVQGGSGAYRLLEAFRGKGGDRKVAARLDGSGKLEASAQNIREKTRRY